MRESFKVSTLMLKVFICSLMLSTVFMSVGSAFGATPKNPTFSEVRKSLWYSGAESTSEDYGQFFFEEIEAGAETREPLPEELIQALVKDISSEKDS